MWFYYFRLVCCLFYLFILVMKLLRFHLGNLELFVLVNYSNLKWGNLACHCAVFEEFEFFRWAIRKLLSVLVLLYTTLGNIISASQRCINWGYRMFILVYPCRFIFVLMLIFQVNDILILWWLKEKFHDYNNFCKTI